MVEREPAGRDAGPERWVYVPRGVGNLWGIRFNCPPEITLLTVTGEVEAICARAPMSPRGQGAEGGRLSKLAPVRSPHPGFEQRSNPAQTVFHDRTNRDCE